MMEENITFSNFDYQKIYNKVQILDKTWNIPHGVFVSQNGIFSQDGTKIDPDLEKEINNKIKEYNRLEYFINLKNRID